MLHGFFIVIHIIVCLVLSAVVLMQSSKGGGLAGAFGGAGGAPQQMLGSRGMTTLLHKLTIYFAVAFFLTSFAVFVTQPSGGGAQIGSDSVMQDAAERGDVQVPVTTTPAEQGAGTEGATGGEAGDTDNQ